MTMKYSREFPSTRMRRTRFNKPIRNLVAENNLTADDLIQPIFVREGLNGTEPINSLPGISRFGLDSLDKEIESISSLGINAVAVFPVIDPAKKDEGGTDSLNENNIVSQAIRQIKSNSDEPVLIHVPNMVASAHINFGNEVARILTLADVAWKPNDNEMQNITFDDYDMKKWRK